MGDTLGETLNKALSFYTILFPEGVGSETTTKRGGMPGAFFNKCLYILFTLK